MNTNDLREIILEKITEETTTNRLRNQLKNSIGQETIANTIKFIETYLSVTPELIDKVFGVAKQKNLLNQFQPIFNEVFNYWIVEYDFIPDNQGMAGICDDAYLSLSLMHLIANTKVPGKGKVLIEQFNLEGMNDSMRKLLGPNISSQLDVIVNATYQSVTIQNPLSALINMVSG
ncbi:MAG: hypothetical protein V3U91_04205, partial [Candidatus Aminicenantaceae bacterium]